MKLQHKLKRISYPRNSYIEDNGLKIQGKIICVKVASWALQWEWDHEWDKSKVDVKSLPQEYQNTVKKLLQYIFCPWRPERDFRYNLRNLGAFLDENLYHNGTIRVCGANNQGSNPAQPDITPIRWRVEVDSQSLLS